MIADEQSKLSTLITAIAAAFQMFEIQANQDSASI
jgi:hypothetical protein